MRRLILSSTLAAVAFSAAPAQAGIWQSIPSGTTDPINAIDYQGDARFWYATANGKLGYRQAGGAFALGTGVTGSIFFNDIAFEPAPGQVGLAVGNDNNVWRTANGGQSWSKSTLPAVIDNPDCSNFGGPWSATGTFDDAYSVFWASASDVYITGNNGNVLKSTNKGANWVEINHKPNASDGTGCRIPGHPNLTDQWWLSTTEAYYISRYFGRIFRTSDALASTPAQKSESVNNANVGMPRIAADAQNRVWAVDRCLDCYSFSSDGAETFPFASMKIRTPNAPRFTAPHDVSQNSGTVVMVGTGNQIINSINGTDFYYQNADSAADWKAVDLHDAAHAAVAGSGGAIAITDKANTVPDVVEPTASIQGPSTGTTGTPVTFTAVASDNAGGSGVDPNGYTWTMTGFPNQTGPSATYTFTNSGSYTVRLTVRDLAGNVSDEVRKSISITQGEAPRATITFPKGAVTARRSGGFVRVKVKGTIGVPAGIDRGKACSGRVLLTVKVGRRQVRGAARAKVTAGCTFRKTLKIRRSKLKRARRVKVTAHFVGNTVLRSQSKTFTVRVR